MAPSLRVIVCTFVFMGLSLGAWAQDKKFPQISQIEIMFYQTEVQVIDVTQQATAYAKEYFDKSEGRGRVETLVVGDRQSVFYYNETNEILEVNSTNCQTWDIDESQYDYMPMFYGWLNKKPLIVGPSAALWFAQGKDTKDEGYETVRAINCSKFSLQVKGPRDDVVMYFYFAVDGWTTPYQMKNLITPIRIVAIGNSSQDTERAEDMVPVNLITDFAYFRPTISEWRVFQPPEGIGCPLRKATISMPQTPKVFKLNAEVYDILKGQQEADQDVEYMQMWYDFVRKIGRLDKFTKLEYKSEIYDFNTGVTYTSKNDETCLIKPLRNSIFESYSGKRLMGSIKEPAEVLNLDGTFYYMGKKTIRGLVADVFETVKLDLGYKDQILKKLVITVYYTDEYMEVAVDGETETRIPVYMVLTGYNETNTVSIKEQYNIFGFSDVIWPDLYTTFQVDRCFPLDDDKSYFVLVVEVSTDVAAKMEEQDDFIVQQLRTKIAESAGISEMRIPFLKADYKEVGVFVTGLMLDRPPALQQFWMEYEGDTSTYDNELKLIIDATTKEMCAHACVDEQDYTCTGFYFCGEACFLKSRELLEDKGENDNHTIVGDNCQTWLRSERESTNYENYLDDALMLLENAVLNSTLAITVYLPNNQREEIPVQDIIIGEGPYTGQDNVDKPYTTVINYAKLNSNDQTTEEVPSVSTLSDCYQACKKSESINCASFSYCPDADNKQCMITSVLVVDRKKNPDDTTDDKNCFVYSLKYLDFYDPYPGRVLLISGEDTVKNIETPEACAKSCREQKKFQCRGFEFCKSTKTCVLHSKHVLDLGPGQISTDSSKNPKCTHYSAKFTTDYDDMGYTLLVDDSDKRTEISLEGCAKACSEELKETCKSFNYCPPTDVYSTDSSCSLSSKLITDKGITTTTKKKCHHYEKKKNVDDWVETQNKKTAPSGYTSGGFAGLVIGMLAFGLIVGALLFVVYSYYKSRNSGEGMSVRFMKQDT